MSITPSENIAEPDVTTLANIERRLSAGEELPAADGQWLVDRIHELVSQVARLQMNAGDHLLELAGTGELADVIETDAVLAKEIVTALAAGA